MERRINVDGIAIEERGAGKNTLVGYAAVFYSPGSAGTEYELRGGLSERVMPTAFNLEGNGRNVLGMWNHSEMLGSLENGTVRLQVDQRGLRYEIDLPDTQAGRDVAALVARGDVRGSSFGFVAKSAPITYSEGKRVRNLESVQLLDVGPVMEPAYHGTTTGMRSENCDKAIEEFAEFQKNMKHRHEIQLKKHLHKF